MTSTVALICSLLLLLIIFAIRSIRWLAILQQKEYRADRLIAFLKSSEGRQELLRIIPRYSDFSRTGLKRPKVTARVVISMVGLSLLLVLATSFGAWIYILLDETLFASTAVSLYFLIVYVFLPFLVMLTAVPTSVIAQWQTRKITRLAVEKLRQSSPLVIGITGSYGKSSTKQLLSHVLSKQFFVFATPRSFNTRYSVAQSIVAGYTGQEIVILEYGAYGPGEIKQLATDIKPDWAIITGFAPQHIALFGSEDAIAAAKAELLNALPEDGKAFITADDAGVKRIVSASKITNDLVTEFSTKDYAWLNKPKVSTQGILEFQVDGDRIQTQLVGSHYTQTIAAVMAVACAMGMSEKKILSQLQTFSPSETFITAHKTNMNVLVINDGGTSNPRGFSAAVSLIGELEYAQKVLVTPGIVDLGERTKLIHLQLAEEAWKAGVSEVLYVGTDGLEEFQTVFGDTRVLNQRDAILATIQTLPPGSLLLIEGRMPGWFTQQISVL